MCMAAKTLLVICLLQITTCVCYIIGRRKKERERERECQVIRTAKTVMKGCNLKTSLMLKSAWHNIPLFYRHGPGPRGGTIPTASTRRQAPSSQVLIRRQHPRWETIWSTKRSFFPISRRAVGRNPWVWIRKNEKCWKEETDDIEKMVQTATAVSGTGKILKAWKKWKSKLIKLRRHGEGGGNNNVECSFKLLHFSD